MGDDTQQIIDLEPITDPHTGETIFAPAASIVAPSRPQNTLVMTDRGLVDEARPIHAMQLPNTRFAGNDNAPFDWREAERQQGSGLVVSMVDGKLVTGDTSGGSQPVALPANRFAAPEDPRFLGENREVIALAQAGATAIVKLLKHSSRFDRWPASKAQGWVYTTKPTTHGDELTSLIAFNPSTGLYHAHFWRFDVRGTSGVMGAVDLPTYLHQHPNLTAHGTHMYPDATGGAVLCLSTAVRGGLPTLTDAVFQAAKWADGMGEVVRGRRFPFRE